MRLSVQLYTVRDQFGADPVGTLRAIKNIGLEYVEGGGSFGGSTAAEGRQMLDDAGLKASGSHVGLEALENDLSKCIDDAKTLNCPFIIVPWISADTYQGGWEACGKRLEAIGRKVSEAGLGFAYHNHDFEFKNSGKPGLNVLYDSSDPSFVKAELDVAWVQIGGQDPANYIRDLKSRLPLLHLKDFDPTKEPRWQPCGQGVVNWDRCLEEVEKANVQFGAIELDEYAGDPMDAVRISFEFFQSKGLR
jgi:sugar phosphate isomerase/epimerase